MLKQIFTTTIIGVACLAGAACAEVQTVSLTPNEAANSPSEWVHYDRLVRVLEKQDTETKARYTYRHPVRTLAFFGVEPGMTVVDMMPGKVWYAGILADFLGKEGVVIGADIPTAMFESYQSVTQERKLTRRAWPTTWPAEMLDGAQEDNAPVLAIRAGELAEDKKGVADLAIIVRGLHSAHRFQVEDEKPFLDTIITDLHAVLKPGGKLGVVQHRAPESAPDAWANGAKGYLKQSRVIALFEAAGFTLVATSEINANPMDRPTEADRVWRLPPANRNDDEAVKAQMQAIGESDRMTLLFQKAG